MKTGRAARNRAARKRRQTVLSAIHSIKKWAWRLTALWCWVHLAGLMICRRDVFAFIESKLSAGAYRLLVQFRFEPTNARLLSPLSKLFWIFTLTEASWVQMLGLLIYVVLAPLWISLAFYFRKLKVQEVPVQRPVPFSAHTTLYLGIALLIWFALYGNSSSRPPLIIALILTAWLLFSRIYEAFIYTSMTEVDGILSRAVHTPYTHLNAVLKQITSGGIKNDDQLMASVSGQRWALKRFRRLSRFLRGRGGKRRASLIVLLQYMSNLITLGLLTVMFWSISIKIANIPTPVSVSDALWATTSHVIPGVPDAEGVKIGKGIQTGISVTAWAIFVLYAGPVASLYPVFHERYLRKFSEYYQELRVGRVLMYRFSEAIADAYKRVHDEKAVLTSETSIANTDNSSENSSLTITSASEG